MTITVFELRRTAGVLKRDENVRGMQGRRKNDGKADSVSLGTGNLSFFDVPPPPSCATQ